MRSCWTIGLTRGRNCSSHSILCIYCILVVPIPSTAHVVSVARYTSKTLHCASMLLPNPWAVLTRAWSIQGQRNIATSAMESQVWLVPRPSARLGLCGCETQHGTFISQEATNHDLKLEQQFIIPNYVSNFKFFSSSGLWIVFRQDKFLISPSVNFSEPNHRPQAGASKDALQVQNFPQAPQGKLQPVYIGQFPP